jgi:insulysin
VNAVDSEFNMSLQNDGWHFYNLLFQMSHPDSAMHKFMCGNKISLSQEGMRDALLAFHKRWYSANIMNMCVLGRFPISELEGWVTEKFSAVVNKDVVVPNNLEPHPYPTTHLRKLIKFVPVKDEDKLNFTYFLPFCG